MIFSKSSGGFTVTELLLVMVIMGIMVSISVPYYQGNRSQFEFNQGVIEINSLIKTARNAAVSSQTYFDGTNHVVPAGGYGVYFNQSPGTSNPHAIYFVNNGDDSARYDAADGILDTYRLDDRIVLRDVELTSPVDYVDRSDNAVVIFRPPLGEVTLGINGNPESEDSLNEQETLCLGFKKPDPEINSLQTILRISRIQGFSETLNKKEGEPLNCNPIQ